MRGNTKRATLDRMLTEQPQRLIRRLRQITGSLADAEDVAQDVVLRALRGVDAVASSDEALLCAWLDTIARHAALNATRASNRRADQEPTETDLPHQPSAERVATCRLDWRKAITALDELPPELADVARLRLLDELSSLEVAHQLGLSEMAVRNRLHRARKLLRAPSTKTETTPLSAQRALLR